MATVVVLECSLDHGHCSERLDATARLHAAERSTCRAGLLCFIGLDVAAVPAGDGRTGGVVLRLVQAPCALSSIG